MEITQNLWGIIINPKSGTKKYRKQRKELFHALKIHNIQFEYRVTRFAGHASEIARYYIENKIKNILVLGGDGTISETINGIFSAQCENTAEVKLALIPRGTGNDWGRFWGLTRNFESSLQVFLNSKTKHIDIGQINFDLEGKNTSHYFINSLGMGLDAEVVTVTHRLKEILGSFSFLYTIALLLAVFKHKAHKTKIYTSEISLSLKMFTMNVANGCFSGGGLKQTPNALPYDGLFDVMLAHKPTFFKIIGALGFLFRGKLFEHSLIETFQTKELYIQTDKSARIEADGIIVNGISPYKINILPSSIQMIIP